MYVLVGMNLGDISKLSAGSEVGKAAQIQTASHCCQKFRALKIKFRPFSATWYGSSLFFPGSLKKTAVENACAYTKWLEKGRLFVEVVPTYLKKNMEIHKERVFSVYRHEDQKLWFPDNPATRDTVLPKSGRRERGTMMLLITRVSRFVRRRSRGTIWCSCTLSTYFEHSSGQKTRVFWMRNKPNSWWSKFKRSPL